MDQPRPTLVELADASKRATTHIRYWGKALGTSDCAIARGARAPFAIHSSGAGRGGIGVARRRRTYPWNHGFTLGPFPRCCIGHFNGLIRERGGFLVCTL